MPTPPRSPDDMPLAAYGGSGMDDGDPVQPDPTAPATPAPLVPSSAGPSMAASSAPPAATAAPGAAAVADLPVPEDEPSHGPSPVARLVRVFRTSRVAAGAGFAVVIIVGLVLLSSGGASPAATATTPSKAPSAAPTIAPPSGDATLTVSGVAAGSFTLTGLAGGQQVTGTSVTLGWGDGQQTTLSIAGPLDRGTRATDAGLVLTIGVLVNGQPVTFTSKAGECTIGMAELGTQVQGSFTCHKLKGPDGKATIEANGTYHS